jgi:hypothetical protein
MAPADAHRLVADRLGVDGHKPFFEFRGRQECIRQAMAKPLPGAAGDAFLRGSVKIEDYVIHEVMPIHLKCLQLVNSPLLDLVTSAVAADVVDEKNGEQKKTVTKTASREFEFSDEWQLCYIFTENPETLYDTPKSELAKLIETSAKAEFRAINSALVNGICSAIVKQFERHISTTVKYATEVDAQTAEKKTS